jgi:hypothetical protein
VVDDLTTTTAGADGHYTADVSAFAALPDVVRAPARIVVDASAPGRRPMGRALSAYATPGGGPRTGTTAPLVLERGATLRGRVVDGAGRPVAGATVTARSADDEHATESRTDAEGRYAVGVEVSQAHSLHVVRTGVGAAVVGPIALSRDVDAEAADVVLRDLGVLEGVARFEDGSPAAGVPVAAAPEGTPTDFDAAEPAPGGGCLTNRTTSGSDGAFRLTGLVPGRYALTAGPGGPTEGAPVYATGRQDADVVVSAVRVRLRVRDGEGRPVPGALYRAAWFENGGEEQALGTVLAADGVVELWGRAGRRLLLSAEVPGHPLAEAVVSLGRGRNEADAALTIRPATGPKGWIRVALTARGGERLESFQAYCVTALSETLIPWREDPVADRAGRLPPLFPGRYRLTVYPGRGPNAAPLELFFPIETVVVVNPGAETPLALEARRGGRVRLNVSARGGAALGEGAVRVEARPRAGGRAVQLPVFVRPADDGGWYVGGVVAKAPCTGLFLFEPGGYDLHVAAEGYKPTVAPLAIAPGEITDVAVVLEPI